MGAWMQLARRPGRTLVAAVMAISAVSAASGCVIRTPTPDLSGQDVALTVVHTSDTHSRFFPYFFSPGAIDKGLGLVPPPGKSSAVIGGIARISTMSQCIRG